MVEFVKQRGNANIVVDRVGTLNGADVSEDQVDVQRIKLGFGAEGTHQDVSAAVPLPVNSVAAAAASGARSSTVSVTTSSAKKVNAKAGRTYLLLVNTGANDVWVEPSDAAAAVVGQGIPLWANGGAWEMPESAKFDDGLRMIANGATSTVSVTEY